MLHMCSIGFMCVSRCSQFIKYFSQQTYFVQQFCQQISDFVMTVVDIPLSLIKSNHHITQWRNNHPVYPGDPGGRLIQGRQNVAPSTGGAKNFGGETISVGVNSLVTEMGRIAGQRGVSNIVFLPSFLPTSSFTLIKLTFQYIQLITNPLSTLMQEDEECYGKQVH